MRLRERSWAVLWLTSSLRASSLLTSSLASPRTIFSKMVSHSAVWYPCVISQCEITVWYHSGISQEFDIITCSMWCLLFLITTHPQCSLMPNVWFYYYRCEGSVITPSLILLTNMFSKNFLSFKNAHIAHCAPVMSDFIFIFLLLIWL